MKIKCKVLALVGIVVFTLTGCSNATETEETSLKVKKTEVQTSEDKTDTVAETEEATIDFSLGEDLKGAICQLALEYDYFDKSVVNETEWESAFISDFILNSRYSFSYLNNLSEENSGIISAEELQYIQLSLTGQEMSFDESVDVSQSSSKLLYGEISDYEFEQEGNEIILDANFVVHYDGSENEDEYSLNVVLVENSDSCFDGFTIEKLSKTPIESNVEATDDTTEKTFYGELDDWIDDTTLTIEFAYSETSEEYKHFVYLDLSQSDDICQSLKDKEIGTLLRITYVNSSEQNGEMYVVPISVSESE